MTIPYTKLAEICNRKRPMLVKRWCEAKGILYSLDADGRPWTTEMALNEALRRGRKTKPRFL